MRDNKKNEKIFLAMSDIDDSLIEEAAPDSKEEKVVKLTGADLIRSNPNFKRYLLAAACFAIVAVLSIPLISSMSSTNKSNIDKGELYDSISSESCDEANIASASSSTTKFSANSVNNRDDVADELGYGSESSSTSPDISYFVDDFKADYGYKLIVNTYTGNALNDKTLDPQGILSQMKTTSAPKGYFYICGEMESTFSFDGYQINGDAYIVAISNDTVGKIMRVYDAKNFQLVLEKPGTCIEDICGDLGIAG